MSGQAPGLLWSTNVGGTLFSVDAAGNSYATANGNVIVINASGQAVVTNAVCPRPGVARRDSSGNYYFSGILSNYIWGYNFPPQDFSGVTLSNSPVYLAKFSPTGNLLWVTNFGTTLATASYWVGVEELVLDANDNPIVGYVSGSSVGYGGPILAFDSSGGLRWSTAVGGERLRLTSESPTNLYVLAYPREIFVANLYRIDGSGAATYLAGWGALTDAFYYYSRIVLNKAGELYNIGNSGFIKRSSSMEVLWNVSAGSYIRIVGPDQYSGVHLASATAGLARYAFDGTLVWTNVLPSNCLELILDQSGNRFLALEGGIVARLASEAGPAISASQYGPDGFSFQVQGSAPVYRIWTNSTMGTWAAAAVVTNSGGSAPFTDPSATNAPTRFYRAEPLP